MKGGAPQAPQEVAHATLKGGTALANAINKCTSVYSVVANAQAVLARSCALKLPMRSPVVLANDVNSCKSDRRAFENAQAVLASHCALNSPMRCSAALANTPNNEPIHLPLPPHAAPCATGTLAS